MFGFGISTPDGFKLPKNHPRLKYHEIASVLFKRGGRLPKNGRYWDVPDRDQAPPETKELKGREGVEMAIALVERVAHYCRKPFVSLDNCGITPVLYLRTAFEHLGRKRLPWTDEDVVTMLKAIHGCADYNRADFLNIHQITNIYARVAEEGEPQSMYRALDEYLRGARDRNWARSIREIVDEKLAKKVAAKNPTIHPEPWADLIRNLSADWQPLIEHWLSATASTPTGKWLKDAQALVIKVSTPDLERLADDVLSTLRAGEQARSENGDLLRGFLWSLSQSKSEQAASLLYDFALVCSKKIPYRGARSTKGTNAAVSGLGVMGTQEGLAKLTMLKSKIKAPQLATFVISTLETAARKQGMPVADLEELVTPTFGIEEVGHLVVDLEDVQGVVSITSADAELVWKKADGKQMGNPPASTQQRFGDDVKELKATVKEMKAVLAAQKDRLESLYLADRSLPYKLWRERYLDQSVIGPMCRRLIWMFGDIPGVAPDGVVVDSDGRRIPDFGEGTPVSLWHPLGRDPEEVRAWREWVFTHELSQPFKQAHRELYVLTEAERQTRTYSNRFAAHVLKQHQMASIAKQRGWKYQLQGGFDNANALRLDLPRWGLQAQFWTDPVDGDTSDFGISMYVVTDQVCFYDLESPGQYRSGERIELDAIPPMVLTEVFRDVDLFVSVCSVATDPNWVESGDARWHGYWREMAFGALNANAETRKEILSRLLPRLQIAKVAHLDERHLVVKGKRKTYKIHLGSGNILMSPNNQYLCIVPGRSAPGQRPLAKFVPFEGDTMLSVILSKAMMLAEDDKITDPTILSQLR